MRRYAPGFVNAFRREVASIDKIFYARSRSIVSPNAIFVSQSGTSATKFTDLPPESAASGQSSSTSCYRKLSRIKRSPKNDGTTTASSAPWAAMTCPSCAKSSDSPTPSTASPSTNHSTPPSLTTAGTALYSP